MSRPSHLPSPMRSPGSEPLHTPTQPSGSAHLPHTPTQLPVTQVTMWGFPSPNGRWLQPDRSPSSPTGCRLDSLSEIRKKKKEEAEGRRKEEEEKERKEEEGGSTGAASSATSASANAQSRFQQRGEGSAHAKAHVRPPPMQQGEGQDPKILTTKFGRVHHRTMMCPYLTNPRTGTVKESRWCEECTNMMGTMTSVTLWTTSWGGIAHSNRVCRSLRGEVLRYTPCSACSGQ